MELICQVLSSISVVPVQMIAFVRWSDFFRQPNCLSDSQHVMLFKIIYHPILHVKGESLAENIVMQCDF